MINSYMITCAKLGLDFVACAPKAYFPDQKLIDECQEFAKESGATLSFEEDVMVATKDADIICTDVWVSMGEPEEVWKERIDALKKAFDAEGATGGLRGAWNAVVRAVRDAAGWIARTVGGWFR